MLFKDYTETGVVYHIATINDLNKILQQGIKYDDKVTYKEKYYDFHQFIDDHRNHNIPIWVSRKKAIFASMNYKSVPVFHSHSVVLAVKIIPEHCWIANENRGNQIYEPFILKDVEMFKSASKYMKKQGVASVREYWDTSLSFIDNLEKRFDKKDGYDAEVLILHSIPPENIEVKYIISDHRVLTLSEWKEIFCQ
ncbi:hypothetical protein [Alkaliphilus transvaalensis]|uniref:hypothetical protein n=1 Tax=Alkaliphilus transvaalensis TaxID=114628 RepID=UPI00047C644E|nr:hypothetical protein [Alkaliphilus transvaalensis]